MGNTQACTCRHTGIRIANFSLSFLHLSCQQSCMKGKEKNKNNVEPYISILLCRDTTVRQTFVRQTFVRQTFVRQTFVRQTSGPFNRDLSTISSSLLSFSGGRHVSSHVDAAAAARPQRLGRLRQPLGRPEPGLPQRGHQPGNQQILLERLLVIASCNFFYFLSSSRGFFV
jgi:hypothetical protein